MWRAFHRACIAARWCCTVDLMSARTRSFLEFALTFAGINVAASSEIKAERAGNQYTAHDSPP